MANSAGPLPKRRCYECKWGNIHLHSLLTLLLFFVYTFREPAVKRTICRRCHYILLAGTSARIRIADDNPKLCELVCEQCNYIRRFPLSETYAGPWLDQPDAVRERLQLEVIPGAVARKAGMRNKPPQITSANKN